MKEGKIFYKFSEDMCSFDLSLVNESPLETGLMLKTILITIFGIAKEAGMSHKTIQHVLNNTKHIKEGNGK